MMTLLVIIRMFLLQWKILITSSKDIEVHLSLPETLGVNDI